MIVVVGRVQTSQDRRDELIKLGQRVAQASRDEAGCIGYRLYENTEQANEFVVVEEWDSEEALQRHFATAHIAAFMAAFPATLSAQPDVQFHTIAETRTLADVAGG